MIRRFLPPHAVLAAAMLILGTPRLFADDVAAAESIPAATEEAASAHEVTTSPGVQFDFDFSTAAGATLTTTNGHSEQRDGDLVGMYSAFASVPDGQPQPLILRVTEDNTVDGPDGKPGVLRLQYVQAPAESIYSGFILSGNQDYGKMQLPGWTLGKVTMADLRRTFIEFKFRSDNPNDQDDFGGMYGFRIEPEHAESYNRRGEFGVLIATQRWRSFRRPIGSGENLDVFLKAVNDENPPNFKLIWSQSGPVRNYRPETSLLIDDVKIVVE